MTKVDLADLIHEKLSCQKKEAVELLDLTLEILKEAIATEGHVKISGFSSGDCIPYGAAYIFWQAFYCNLKILFHRKSAML